MHLKLRQKQSFPLTTNMAAIETSIPRRLSLYHFWAKSPTNPTNQPIYRRQTNNICEDMLGFSGFQFHAANIPPCNHQHTMSLCLSENIFRSKIRLYLPFQNSSLNFGFLALPAIALMLKHKSVNCDFAKINFIQFWI